MSVNVAMWMKALKVIPKISESEWKELDLVSRWLISSRGAVFVMTAFSAIIGGILAAKNGVFHFVPFIVAFFGLIFAHATNNLLNDWTDTKKGVDKGNYFRNQYGPQALEHHLLSEKQIWFYILGSFSLALLCGIYLVATTPPLTIYLMLAGIFFIAFYTWPLKYIGLGEITVLIVWGPLMIGGTYYVVSGGIWDWNVALISLVYSIGPTGVLFGKHIDKLTFDREKKIYTLPVILGETAARYSVIALWILQYGLIFYMVVNRYFSPVLLITLLALPSFWKSFKIFSRPRPTEPPSGYENAWPLYLVSEAFLYNRRFGGLFILGLLVDMLISRIL